CIWAPPAPPERFAKPPNPEFLIRPRNAATTALRVSPLVRLLLLTWLPPVMLMLPNRPEKLTIPPPIPAPALPLTWLPPPPVTVARKLAAMPPPGPLLLLLLTWLPSITLALPRKTTIP